MEKLFVKIDRSTIKRNPNAGQTSTRVFGTTDVSFVLEGPMPEWIAQDENIVVTSTRWSNGFQKGNIIKTEGIIRDPGALEQYYKIPGINITKKFNSETYYHAPLPEWLYQYENPLVNCNSCHQSVKVSDIIHDWNDWDVEYDECPNCHETDTFPERIYESINDTEKPLN